MSVYDFHAVLLNGQEVGLSEYRGKALLIVNTASKCGLTPHYEGIQRLHETYGQNGFTVLGFPCNQFGGQEPGTDEDIQSFCTTNYQVTFPLFSKVDVNGEHAHPLFQYLREQAPDDAGLDQNGGLYRHLKEKSPELLEGSNIRWNFTKFLIDREGRVFKRYAPTTLPESLAADIEALL